MSFADWAAKKKGIKKLVNQKTFREAVTGVRTPAKKPIDIEKRDADVRRRYERDKWDKGHSDIAYQFPSGRLGGHGMNMDAETYRRAVEFEKEDARRTAAGIKSIGYSFAGALPSLAETAQQQSKNYCADLKNMGQINELKKKREDLANRYAQAYYGHADAARGTKEQLWSQIEAIDAQIESLKTKTPVDQNRFGQRMMAKSQQLHQEATEGLPAASKFLADTGISIGSSLPGVAVGVVNPAAGLGVLGAQAAAQKSHELNARGVEPGEALSRGVVSGLIEAATEKIPLDNLIDIVKVGGGKSFIKGMLKQSGIEATEESASYFMNYIADQAAKDPTSQWSWNELLQSAGMGAVSGGLFATAGTAFSGPINRIPKEQISAKLRKKGLNPVLSEKQATIINSALSGVKISEKDAATIAKSPAALTTLSEITGQEIDADAPIPELAKTIMALPAAFAPKALPVGREAFAPVQKPIKAPGLIPSGPTIALPQVQTVPPVHIPPRIPSDFVKDLPPLQAVPGVYDKDPVSEAPAEAEAPNQTGGAVIQTLPKAKEKVLQDEITSDTMGAKPIEEVTFDEKSHTKGLPVFARSLFKKWAANEWVNVDLSDANSKDASDYAKFFARWYQAGKAGVRKFEVEYDDVDAQHPVFLQDVFYDAGKKAAAQEAVKAAKSKEGAKKDEITSNGAAKGEPPVPGETGGRTLEKVAPEDVQGAGAAGKTVRHPVRAGGQSIRSASGTDAERIGRGRSLGDRERADIPATGGVTEESPDKPIKKQPEGPQKKEPKKPVDKAPQGAPKREALSEETPEQEAVADAVSEKEEQTAAVNPKGENFVIGESLRLPSGEKARFNANVAAIQTAKKLVSENRYATAEEQIILSKYVGWGGLANAFDEKKEAWSKEFKQLKNLLTEEEYKAARASTLNAHYTSVEVIHAMYEGLKGLGFHGGRMLEPSGGTGNFIGAMPMDMSSTVNSWTLVELDNITGLIAQYLYPNADVRIQGFEKALIPDNYIDVAIGNVPFGNFAIVDKAYPKAVTSSIHNYFFGKALDKVRPGGIVMFITSRYTLDGGNNEVRKYMADRADLLGAIRLPDTAFQGNAGTEVVTDIIVLKKRDPGTPYTGEDFADASSMYIDGRYAGSVNDYYKNHPEMVLGTASMEGTMYAKASLTYKPLPGNLEAQIKKAFQNIKVKMEYPSKPPKETINRQAAEKSKNTKEGGFIAKDGKIFIQLGGELVQKDFSEKDAAKVSSILSIRDVARDLLNAQLAGKPDSDIKKLRTALNKAYDGFVKKNGFLNSQSNIRLIKDDPDFAFIQALENYDKDTKTGTKADIFAKNTVARNVTVTHVDSPAEGLIVSVNETGSVDMDLISRLSGIPLEEAARNLMDAGLIYKIRGGGYETAEQYLSGNVRAKLRDAEALATMDKDFQSNVEALRKIIPADVPYQAIHVTPGVTWIPTEVYEAFAANLIGVYNYGYRKEITMKYNGVLGSFTVEASARAKKTVGNLDEWGTKDRSFLNLYERILNNKSLTVSHKDSDGKVYVDKQATIAANEKADTIKAEFQKRVWEDEHRRNELAKLYNEMFNNTVNPKYNGADLTVDGANAAKPLRPHQKDVVQRIIMSGGNTLIAHEVGAGKTAEMAAAAMKLRQLGIVKKPMFIVPKSLVAQWGREFLDFFPAAKVLVAGEHDTEKKNRRAFANRVATGDYDAVILSYENFKAMPMSAETQQEFLAEQITELEMAIDQAVSAGSRRDPSVKQMEKAKKNLEAKIADLGSMKKDEDNIDFESLGVDSLFVDEAHNYKNLFYTTNMNNVSGLGDKKGSQRAFDLYMKVRWLQQLNGGRGVVFATATPVMNSMSEMYIMQKYLQYDLLKQRGLTSFDAWANQFGEVRTVMEIKPSGKGYRQKESFSRFRNLPELMQMFHKFADVLIDIPGLKIPKVTRETIVAQPSEYVTAYIDELEKRAEAVSKGSVDPSEDNMLKITSDGRKASYTQRMIDPSLPYEEGSKIGMCVDKVFEVWKSTKKNKSTQLIFCDMATPKGEDKAKSLESSEDAAAGEDAENVSLYNDIKKQLVLKGVPAKEIAFIHDANTQAKKAKLFDDVNAGRVRVLIGSTGKMGVGMNAQKKIIALHHLDSPWRPGDVKQQEGRMLRQGNENEETHVYTYVTEGTFDARMWDGLERKAKFINAVMTGTSDAREIEDVGEQALSFAEIKALASGDPLIQEQVEVSNQIQKLSAMKAEHVGAVRRAQAKLQEAQAGIPTRERQISSIEKDIKLRQDISRDMFSMTVGGKTYAERAKAGDAILKEAKRLAKASDSEIVTETIGAFAGFELQANSKGDLFLIGSMKYPASLNVDSASGTIQSLETIVRGLETRLSGVRALLEKNKTDAKKLESLANAPFEKQDELNKLIVRHNEILQILNPQEDAGAAIPDNEELDKFLSPEDYEEEVERLAASHESPEEKWSADRSGSSAKAPMRLSDIIGKIRYDFDIPVTTGHIRGSKTLGQYNKKAIGIRTKIANDLPTVSHELGHHLDNTYGLTKGIDSELRQELEDGLPEAMKAAYKKTKWVTEGLAEFVRHYLQNPETAAIDYPLFTEHFRKALSDQELALVDELANEVNAYYALDAETASSAIRIQGESYEDFRDHAEKIKDFGDQCYQAWIDSNHGIKRFDQAIGAKTYKLASNSAYSDAVAYSVLTGDLTDINGRRVGKGLFQALSDINVKNKKEFRDFGEYLVVKHGPERLKEGLRVFADDRMNSSAWMDNRMEELEQQYPKFKVASEKLYKFQQSFLLTWGVDTGLVSSESAKKWAERWEYYVPFNRAINGKGRIGAKRGFANQNSTIKKARGSGLDLQHPVDNIINNIVKMVNAGARNNVMAEITKAAGSIEGTAVFLEKVPMPLKKTVFDLKGTKEGLKQSAVEAGLSKDAEDKVFGIINDLDDLLIQFGRGHASGDVVTVLKNGNPEYWKINDPMLLSSITNMSPPHLPAWLEAYGRVSQFMTGNITGMNLIWSIFSNFPRDLMTFFTYSSDKNPLHLLGGIGAAYLNKIKGNRADPLYKEYIAMGGGRTSAYTADKNLARNIRKKLAGDKRKWLNPIEWVEFVADTVELGPRFSYYKILRNKGFSTQEAFYGSTDITVNFRRGGVNSKSLNKMIPFFNASVQGLDKYARWQTAADAPEGKRAKMAACRGVGLFAASLALAALAWGMNSGDDDKKKDYAQLSNFTKNNYWCIPLGDGKYFAIPKPRELGVLSSVMETAAEYFANGNRHAFDDFSGYFAEMTLPNVFSDLAQGDVYGAIGSLGVVGVGAYMMANRDFLGKPIVSESLKQLEPKDRYTGRTSKIAYWMGQAFNISPQMADYFFQQTLGGWWKVQKALLPVGGENVDYTLGVQNTYVKDNRYSTDLVNRLYDGSDAASRKSKSNPGDINAAITAKWYDVMTTFYSRYAKLGKEDRTSSARSDRQTVLNMLSEFMKNMESGNRTGVQKSVESICKKTGDTKYLPSAVQSTIKDDAGADHNLNAKQYVRYQTEYLTHYWDYVGSSLKHGMDKSESASIAERAKATAATNAKAQALNRLGVESEDYAKMQDQASYGIAPWESILYESAYAAAKSDKDENGKTIPNSKQRKVINALDGMLWLTNEERDYLFSEKYRSRKNNPYIR